MALSFMKYLLFHVAIFILFPNSSHAADHRLANSKKHVALFVFGDSLFDVGNNNYINTTTTMQANFWPYGETFFNHPTGRGSDGRLIPDFIGDQLTRELTNLVSKVSMALSFMKYLFFHAAVFFLFANSSHADHRLANSKKHVALFVFGDSLFDVGNNNYINTTTTMQANFWPYGETFFNHPTGRASNGRLIPDFIGALAQTHQGMVIDLNMQLIYFKNVKKVLEQHMGETEAKKILSTAVYLFSIGNNDYLSPFWTNSSFFQLYSPEDYAKMVIGNITDVIKEIYEAGGRKFAFVSLAPLDCVPLVRALNPAGECLQELSALIKLHNTAFSKVLTKLEMQLQGFKYSNFDLYNSFTERIENPSKYGFKEGKSACCGSGPYRGVNSCGGKRGVKEYELCSNPSEFVFFDAAHPNERLNEQLAQQMWSATEYAKLPLLPPYKQPGNNHQFSNGANFASAGAGALVQTHQGRVIDLNMQLIYFKNVKKVLEQHMGETEAKRILSTAVYLFSIGSNDYMLPFVTNSNFFQLNSPEDYVKMVIGNITDVIKEIYEAGGRKFAFVSLGPLDCAPLVRVRNPAGECLQEVTALIKLHNTAFSKVLTKLEMQLQGFKYSNFDFYSSAMEIIENPSKYGFKDGKSACCGSGPYRGVNSCGGKRGVKEYELCSNPSEYFLFDAVHPTEKGNEQLAQQMWSAAPSIVGPYNLEALFEQV
ncbi:hypothetical protein RHGRI_005803 [Rhododendron griersonianum]|uniref:Uncharacterized protein n=1 Tax=Rhododendron griersonianum TaxID=479676 RepID=A0AAV6LGH7_9ERIC|nr:hypothetical protein RHGRI_005803 [Rhododendron griersonianum]KAG5563170.1 hypothetical protein RHGRI_005803 [Rhododendron griersonianum]